MLLTCDLRDWVPAGHIVHFILESVEQLPTASFHVNHCGSGSAQYPPAITTSPGNATAVSGQTATFTVAATGSPAPTYQWQRQAAGMTGFVVLVNGGAYAGVTRVIELYNVRAYHVQAGTEDGFAPGP